MPSTPVGTATRTPGVTETALPLALDPGRVRMDRRCPATLRPLAELMPQLRAGGVRAVSPTGVLGDPTTATAAEGIALLDRWPRR